MCLVFNQENLMLWLAAWREKSAPPHLLIDQKARSQVSFKQTNNCTTKRWIATSRTFSKECCRIIKLDNENQGKRAQESVKSGRAEWNPWLIKKWQIDKGEQQKKLGLKMFT